jgi:hypothetical protein
MYLIGNEIEYNKAFAGTEPEVLAAITQNAINNIVPEVIGQRVRSKYSKFSV